MYQPATKARHLLVVAAAAALFASAAELRQSKAETKEAEVEGPVGSVTGSCPALRFTVAGTSVVTDSATRFDDGTCADVANGRRVEVDGLLQVDGTLLAREVDLD